MPVFCWEIIYASFIVISAIIVSRNQDFLSHLFILSFLFFKHILQVFSVNQTSISTIEVNIIINKRADLSFFLVIRLIITFISVFRTPFLFIIWNICLELDVFWECKIFLKGFFSVDFLVFLLLLGIFYIIFSHNL